MTAQPSSSEPGRAPGPSDEAAVGAAVAAGDDRRARKAVSDWAERLRAGRGDDDASVFALECAPLASHPNPKIREAVAAAADVVPEATFDAWLVSFGADGDQYVRAAIARAAKKRAVRRKARARQGEHERAVADVLVEIESKYKKAGRQLAERAIRRGTSSFVRKLHHEATKIATPLEYSLVRLRSELARPDLDRVALERSVAIACERFKHLWTILDRARQATTTPTPCFREESLLVVLEESRAQLVDRLDARADRLALTLDVARDLRLDMDRSAFQQALQNFLQNAVEAYPDEAQGFEVAVAARLLRAGSQVEVTVVDRGVGMNEAERDLLFVPFGSRKPGGTGVGLVIARAMIEEVHGGSLTVESAPGVGTTITIVLPARQIGREK